MKLKQRIWRSIYSYQTAIYSIVESAVNTALESKLLNWLLTRRSSYVRLNLPSFIELWQQERQLQQQALQLATAAIPQFRASDVSLVENLRELEELDPLLHNAAQLYQAELDLRAEGELLRQALTADIWWKIATPAERAAWRERVMKGV